MSPTESQLSAPLDEYPIFIPPEPMATKPRRDWSKPEAEAYFDWLMGCMDERVAEFLKAIDLKDDRTGARSLIASASDRAVELLMQSPCSEAGDNGTRDLTNIGRSIAADLGLFVAKQIIRTAGNTVKWAIIRKPKSDYSYNLPVLSGFGAITYDPVGVSIVDARYVLLGKQSQDAWLKVYDSVVANAARRV